MQWLSHVTHDDMPLRLINHPSTTQNHSGITVRTENTNTKHNKSLFRMQTKIYQCRRHHFHQIISLHDNQNCFMRLFFCRHTNFFCIIQKEKGWTVLDWELLAHCTAVLCRSFFCLFLLYVINSTAAVTAFYFFYIMFTCLFKKPFMRVFEWLERIKHEIKNSAVHSVFTNKYIRTTTCRTLWYFVPNTRRHYILVWISSNK